MVIRRVRRPVVLAAAAAAAVLAGCGSGGGSHGGRGIDGISIANCLNDDENFLLQRTGNALDGQSPAGVVFTLTLYKDAAAAKSVAAKRSKKTTAVVENGVVDFRGNPTPNAGGPPAGISQVEL